MSTYQTRLCLPDFANAQRVDFRLRHQSMNCINSARKLLLRQNGVDIKRTRIRSPRWRSTNAKTRIAWTRVLASLLISFTLFVSMCPGEAQAQQDEMRILPGMTLTVEPFCSETRLRTSNARLHWSVNKATLEASNLTALATTTQNIETTVYKNGFEKGLMLRLPIARTDAESSLAIQSKAAQPRFRAFQIELTAVEHLKTSLSADTEGEMTAVVEDLEPAMNYSWRVTMETSTGRATSSTTTIQALVCPADLEEMESNEERAK